MTNREKVIKELTEHNIEAAMHFLCPYIPGTKHSHCETGEDVSMSECKVCINEWLDREINDGPG